MYVIAVTIPKGISKPYYTSEHKYYIRVGTTKRSASREDLLRLFEANGSIHYDISPVYDTSIKDLNLDIVRECFLKYNTFDLYEEDKDTVERILINGRLQDIAEQMLVVFKNNIKTPSSIKDLKREEIEEYPTLVLREAIGRSCQSISEKEFKVSCDIVRKGRINNAITLAHHLRTVNNSCTQITHPAYYVICGVIFYGLCSYYVWRLRLQILAEIQKEPSQAISKNSWG